MPYFERQKNVMVLIGKEIAMLHVIKNTYGKFRKISSKNCDATCNKNCHGFFSFKNEK